MSQIQMTCGLCIYRRDSDYKRSAEIKRRCAISGKDIIHICHCENKRRKLLSQQVGFDPWEERRERRILAETACLGLTYTCKHLDVYVHKYTTMSPADWRNLAYAVVEAQIEEEVAVAKK